MDGATAAKLDRVLAEYGLTVHLGRPLSSLEEGSPAAGRLEHADSGDLGPILVLASAAMTLADVAPVEGRADTSLPLLVLGPQIGARSSEAFRSADIHYLDAAGNAHLRFLGVLIDVRGRRATAPARAELTLKRTNLFSTKRAQVIFSLISWPDLLGAPVRTIAQRAKVSVGLVQETMELLRSTGHLDRRAGPTPLRRLPELIDRWTSAYPLGLGSLDRAHLFHGATAEEPILTEGTGAYISGDAAVDELHGTTLSLYLDEWSPRIAGLNRWRSDREPNIVVRSTFWSDPRDPASLRQIEKAPPLLIYADLLAADEGRQREAAHSLRAVNPHLRAA
ncbi:type IV toxin-antitoxin system AbiEi family antitoxin [Rathayibacter festucae]|uniref:type IV toxin-antitoxin system AbiEi family antitoxin n=1 Tax=Rathayibacter festucae TaxID=110937 RepID=UPI002A6A9CD5|nr:type IV toxin-antitoxin system AbiEi family antitoxin [Rathayibacter festucae]MDY0915061.1 type IV toxin-antitoxin system AbiEi family antitoxin [Rathayibacter festucae]